MTFTGESDFENPNTRTTLKGLQEHDARVRAVFRRLEDNGVTLNFEKCEFAQSRITYLGHVVSADGIRADPSKVRAIKQMQKPKEVRDIRRFLGMANQLGKFIPNLRQ